jgi:hypothetical protein
VEPSAATTNAEEFAAVARVKLKLATCRRDRADNGNLIVVLML